LAIEREVIAILVDQDVRKQRGAGDAAFDRARRSGGLHDRIAAGAGELGAHGTDHFEAHRIPLEHLRSILAKRLEYAATGRAVLLGWRDRCDFATKMRGKLASGLALAPRQPFPSGGDEATVPVGCFELFNPELKLTDLPLALFALRAKLEVTQLANLQL